MKVWSKIKKQLESYTCDQLKGRVEFHVANYRRAHDNAGRAYIVVDKDEVFNMCTLKRNISLYNKEKQIFREHDFDIEPYDFENYTSEQWALHHKNYDLIEKDSVFSQDDFFSAVYLFLNTSIEDNLKSENPIVKIFCLIDRRLGKRTLISMKDSISKELKIVQFFYKLRCDVEGIS